MADKKGFSTRQIHEGKPKIPGTNPLNTPVFQTSTFLFENTAQGAARFLGEDDGYIYTRLSNPNATEVGAKVASLEGAQAGLLFSSGMGAISSVLWTVLKAGDHVVSDRSLYGCTYELFTEGLRRFGVEVTRIEMTDPEALQAALRPNTRLVYCETICNPDTKLNDIGMVARIAHEYNPDICVMVDNTFASPYHVRPIELGADVVVHSATKYINGHGDVIAGVAVGKAELMEQVRLIGLKYMTGSVPDPFEAYLITRGLKTLDIRMEKHSRNALKVAQFLESHPAVRLVAYPGLESHPQHELAKREFTGGYGGMVMLELDCTRERASEFLDNLEVCCLGVSLGDAYTLIEHPASMTHSTYTAQELEASGFRDTMIRLSVGLEDADDLIADMGRELDRIMAEKA